MIDTSKIIYSINIEDIQNVAEEELKRKLTKKELEIIEDKLGDYIDWYSAIDIAIQNEILHHGGSDASKIR
jgi:glutamyl-tRNA reductase